MEKLFDMIIRFARFLENNLQLIIATLAFIVAYAGFKKNKKRIQREASYQYILNSYISKTVANAMLNEALKKKGEDKDWDIKSTRLARFYYSRYDNKRNWKNLASLPENADFDSIIVNQICFELADCLEILGEAFISGLFQIGLAIRFVGNNFVEDWVCIYPWVQKLRKTDDGDEVDAYSQKRGYAELLAKFAFAEYLCDYQLNGRRPNHFKAYLEKDIDDTLEAFGNNKAGGFCKARLECPTSNNPNVNIFVLAADLFCYLEYLCKHTKRNCLFVYLPDDFNRMVNLLTIRLIKICHDNSNTEEVKQFIASVEAVRNDRTISKKYKMFRNPIWYCWTIIKLETKRAIQATNDFLF